MATTRKTPEQIARETYGQEPGHGWAVGSSEIIPMIVAAIEADRAQRETPAEPAGTAAELRASIHLGILAEEGWQGPSIKPGTLTDAQIDWLAAWLASEGWCK